jgi:hypothetical protein
MTKSFRCRVAKVLLVSMLFWLLPISAFAQGEATPSIKIVAPEKGATVRAGEALTVMVVATGEDIANLAILCDDKGIALLDKTPYSATLDTTNLAAGEHLLRAFAYLKNGEKVGAEPVAFTVLTGAVVPVVTTSGGTEKQQVTLKEGTPLLLRTTKEMVSGKVAKGSSVDYIVARDVLGPEKRVLVEYGAHAYGKVTTSNKRGMFGKNGKLEFTVESVTAADGTNIPLRGSEGKSGQNNTGAVVVTALFLSVLAVFVNGRDVTIPEGTEVAAYVDKDTIITTSTIRSGEVMGAPVESIEVNLPLGARVKAGENLRVAVSPQPADKAFRLRLLCDDKEKLSRDNDFKPVDMSTSGIKVGKHSLQVEVTFKSGMKVHQTVEFEVI